MIYFTYDENYLKMKNIKKEKMYTIDPDTFYSISEIKRLKLLPSERGYMNAATIRRHVEKGILEPAMVKKSKDKRSYIYIQGKQLIEYAKKYFPPYLFEKLQIKGEMGPYDL
jgi:hypothetical protein